MKRQTRWTPDTHPEISFVLEWDDQEPEDSRAHTCIEAIQKDGKKYTGKRARELHDEALGLNQHKNLVLIPAILESLPADEKIPVRNEHGELTGEHTFKNAPHFIAENGEIKADFSSLKPANRLKAAAAMEKKRRVK